MDLVSESAAWSRGEAAAWGSSVAGEVLFEFGPLGRKSLLAWHESEVRSLAGALERGLVDSAEGWGLVSLCVSGRQRTGLQCRSYARQHLTLNEQRDAAFFQSLGGEAEACCGVLRARAGGVHPPVHFAGWTRLAQQPLEVAVAAAVPMEEDEELPVPPVVDLEAPTHQDFSLDNTLNLTNDEQTNDSATPFKRKRRLRAVEEDDSDEDSHARQTPQELHDFVVSKIVRKYLDVCGVLQKKVKDLVLENKTLALDKRVTTLLTELRHTHQINEKMDFLNGYDSDEANPDIPKGMSKRYFKELKRLSTSEAKKTIRTFLDKAEELLEGALKVKVVEEVDEEDEEEEEEEVVVASGGGAVWDHKEEEARGRRSKREGSALWIAKPSADREGEALEINQRRQHLYPRSSSHNGNPGTRKKTANTSGRRRDPARLAVAPEPRTARTTTTTTTTTVSGNTPRSSLELDPRRHPQRRGFMYHTTDITFMPIGPNSELPTSFERAAQPALRRRAPVVLSQSFFQPLPLAAVKRNEGEKKQPPVAIRLVRKIQSAKGLDDLVHDFVCSKGDVSLWADLLERLSRAEMDVDYLHSLIRPLVECVWDVQSSAKRCLFLKTLRQVPHCTLVTRNLLAFLMVYGHLESMLLSDSEHDGELQVLESLGQDAWDVCLGALQVLKLGHSRYEVSGVVLDQWEEGQGGDFAGLFPQTKRSTRRKVLEWVEFSWVTLARVLPIFPPRANWKWIEDKLLGALPCWFGKHAGGEAVAEEERGKWTNALRAVWRRPQAVAGDYVALTAERLLQLTPAVNSFVPVLFRACCNVQSRDLACLTELLQVELALPHARRLVVDILSAVKQNASNKLGTKMLLALTTGAELSKAHRDLCFNELVAKCAVGEEAAEAAVEVALDLCRLASCAREFDTVLAECVRPVLGSERLTAEVVVEIGTLALGRSSLVGFVNGVLCELPLTRETFALVVDNLPLLVEQEEQLGEDVKRALEQCARMAAGMLAAGEAGDLTARLLNKVRTWAYLDVGQGFGVFTRALDEACEGLGLPAQSL